jgi:ABC-type transporter Mla subunit MlaD
MQNQETIELACVVMTAFALVTQVIILLAVTLGASKSIKSIKGEIEELRSAIVPVVHSTRELMEKLSPKVEQTVTDLSEVAKVLRKQAAELDVVSTEVLTRVRKETGRIDTMLAETLDAVDKASTYVTQAVNKPIRQISGVLASAKAIIESLSTPAPPAYRQPTYRDDKDLFV